MIALALSLYGARAGGQPKVAESRPPIPDSTTTARDTRVRLAPPTPELARSTARPPAVSFSPTSRPAPPSLLDGISLTAQQRATARATWQREVAGWQALMARRRPDQPPDPADVEALRAISARSMAAVETVLTPEQREQFERNRARIQAMLRDGGTSAAGGKP